MKLVFAIPTWNRADKLFQCVTAIADQNPDGIFISDNCSDDHTLDVCKALAEKYPCVSYIRLSEHVFAEENFKSVVSFAEGDYIWTFGDDDILLPGALNFARTLLSHEFEFYHVAEKQRSCTHSAKKDTLLNLCCDYGLIEMTGFITGNITRAVKLKQAYATKNWEVYARSAFSHSLALLEVLANSECALVDIAMVRAAEENEDTATRWMLEQTTMRYVFVVEGLMLLRDATIIPDKLPEKFFRYLTGTLVKRMMNDCLARTFKPEPPITEREWKCLEEMVRFIEDPRGAVLMEWFKRVEAACINGLPIILGAIKSANDIRNEANTIELPEYPFTYLS
jgi:glycosyltransferase involved in cell wall biosynthesis